MLNILVYNNLHYADPYGNGPQYHGGSESATAPRAATARDRKIVTLLKAATAATWDEVSKKVLGLLELEEQ